jgi:exonuclease VII large subunit
MAKTVSPTPRRRSATKKAATPSAVRAHKPTAPVNDDILALLDQRFAALEEKLTGSVSSLTTQVAALAARIEIGPAGEDTASETALPVMVDALRHSLAEHLTPITAALKRLEERVGFIGNRLKSQPGGQERQKPWRQDHARQDHARHGRPRPSSSPRPNQGQQWTPPSAASVQGHFAPRPHVRVDRGNGGMLDDEE